jgi:hypothetical protein
MALITKKPMPKLRKASQPPLSYPGATADADRAKKPSLAEAAIKVNMPLQQNKIQWSLAELAKTERPTVMPT